jgi:site-specific DNA-methyltransferase (adenine-specific)
MDEQSGDRPAGSPLTGQESSDPTNGIYGEFRERRVFEGYGDRGGASRFFYCAKPSTAEREAGLVAVPGTQRANVHPTVKSIALMEYLVKLVTPPRGLVLDPFAGSGTTGIAAFRLGHRFVGFERDPDYHAIALARINAARGAQLGLFGGAA